MSKKIKKAKSDLTIFNLPNISPRRMELLCAKFEKQLEENKKKPEYMFIGGDLEVYRMKKGELYMVVEELRKIEKPKNKLMKFIEDTWRKLK